MDPWSKKQTGVCQSVRRSYQYVDQSQISGVVSGGGVSLTWTEVFLMSEFVFVSVMAIFPMSLVSACVSIPVTSVFVCVPSLISVFVPVVMFTVCVASIGSLISGRCSAAAPLAPSSGGLSLRGLTAPLQACGAQRVQEEALVRALQRTLNPDRRTDRQTISDLISGSVTHTHLHVCTTYARMTITKCSYTSSRLNEDYQSSIRC